MHLFHLPITRYFERIRIRKYALNMYIPFWLQTETKVLPKVKFIKGTDAKTTCWQRTLHALTYTRKMMNQMMLGYFNISKN